MSDMYVRFRGLARPMFAELRLVRVYDFMEEAALYLGSGGFLARRPYLRRFARFAFAAVLAVWLTTPAKAMAATATPSPLTCSVLSGTLVCPETTVTSGAVAWAAQYVQLRVIGDGGFHNVLFEGDVLSWFGGVLGSPAGTVPSSAYDFNQMIELSGVGFRACEEVEYVRVVTVVGSGVGVVTGNGGNTQDVYTPGGVCSGFVSDPGLPSFEIVRPRDALAGDFGFRVESGSAVLPEADQWAVWEFDGAYQLVDGCSGEDEIDWAFMGSGVIGLVEDEGCVLTPGKQYSLTVKAELLDWSLRDTVMFKYAEKASAGAVISDLVTPPECEFQEDDSFFAVGKVFADLARCAGRYFRFAFVGTDEGMEAAVQIGVGQLQEFEAEFTVVPINFVDAVLTAVMNGVEDGAEEGCDIDAPLPFAEDQQLPICEVMDQAGDGSRDIIVPAVALLIMAFIFFAVPI